jgi:putative phosphoribosyl transferase
MRFANRAEAGRRLAERVVHLRGADPVVLGLPRGGVVVAFEIAQALAAPLDVIVVRKLGVPFRPELAMGAVGEGGVRVLNPDVLRAAGITDGELARVEQAARAELSRRVERLRRGRARVPLTGRTAVIVDDGIATGATARAGCQVARAQGAARVVLAVPVAPARAVAEFNGIADEVVCLELPVWLASIGQWYADFTQIPDERVTALLELAGRGIGASPTDQDDPPGPDTGVAIRAGPVELAGTLTVPPAATGLVVFVHGSGSSRHSPRNRYVAARLTAGGLGTLLFDLLTPAEEIDRRNVFDIALLARRLVDVISWLRRQPEWESAPIGLFGASTGAAAALWAATEPGTGIGAVVSRGGRPDLASARLDQVRAPTLLIVGGLDQTVLDLNRAAQARLRGPHRLTVVEGATHLFEEPGTLQTVADLARDWFRRHLRPAPPPPGPG